MKWSKQRFSSTFGWTRQEKRVLLFLLAAGFAGAVAGFGRSLFGKSGSLLWREPETQVVQRHSSCFQVDLNHATREELETLPGIGPKLSARIVRLREKQGGFSSVQELLQVPGIGRKTLQQLKPYLVVKPEAPEKEKKHASHNEPERSLEF